jgi:preprotein translocase SecE subunit
MNKPANVDFLIATDSEMKKVNWTSRRELIGSTKVVIIFMFAIAAILFVLDLLFNTLFYAIRVLEIRGGSRSSARNPSFTACAARAPLPDPPAT